MMSNALIEMLARQRMEEAMHAAAEQRLAQLTQRNQRATLWSRLAALLVAGARAGDGGRISPHASGTGQMPRL